MSATWLTLGGSIFMGISRLMQFHENPAVIAWWRTRMGRALGWLTPSRRRAILAAAAVCIGIINPLVVLGSKKGLLPADVLGVAFVIIALFGILYLTYRAASRFAALPAVVRRHPQLTLHLFYWSLLAVLWNTAPTTGLWRVVLLGVAMVFPLVIWRCNYLLLSGQLGKMAGTRFTDHLIYLWPAYGGTNSPIAMGYGHLSRNEAKTEEELAKSQLAGIKLILLGLLWGISLYAFQGLVYGDRIPTLGQLVKQGGDAPLGAAWASIYCELVKQVLRLASGGHIAIGILRLFGFNAFRNTYKPLLAESVMEFWNRYYYYFKELLANFFFLPTFTGLGKKLKNWPQLRLFFAVFAAAFIGNMYYHVLEKTAMLVCGDVFEVLYDFRSRIFYCLLLAVGIYVSMLRQQHLGGHPRPPGIHRRLLRMAGVWTFFGLIFIWDVKSRASFSIRTDFFLGLFGLT